MCVCVRKCAMGIKIKPMSPLVSTYYSEYT